VAELYGAIPSVGAARLRVIKNGVLYVTGVDISDSNKRKIFLISPVSGEVWNAFEVPAECALYDVGVADNGTMYFSCNQLLAFVSPKIYKVTF
jgi:hypothetical protein